MNHIKIQEHKGGIYLPEADLWLDPHHAVERAVVTHAHADHVAPHALVLASVETCHLLATRYRHNSTRQAVPWNTPVPVVDGFTISLHPAGHVLGSAMVKVTRTADGRSLLYTGDFKMRTGLSSAPVAPVAADLLIMECTFGLPQYEFPPYETTRAEILHWAKDGLAAGKTPILLGYSLGKAQELMAIFHGSGIPLCVHSSVAEMCQAYAELGVSLPEYEVLGNAGTQKGRVIIAPPSIARGQQIRNLPHKITAMASGWALQASARFQTGVDRLFPLSDHAGYSDLLAMVKAVQPQRILTTHGYSEIFAADLRNRGWDAWTLAGRDQRELALDFGEPQETPTPTKPAPTSPTSQWAAFCHLGDSVAAVPSRTEKTQLLADYLASLTDPDLPLAVRFLAGEPAPTRQLRSQLQTGWATIRLAMREQTGLSEAAYKTISHSQHDLGRTTQLVLERGQPRPENWSLADVQTTFDNLRLAPGGLAKTQVLKSAFAALTPTEGRWLVKVLTGDTRMGTKEGVLEEAIAQAFQAPAEKVREVHMLTGDLGETAILAKRNQLNGVQMRPFQPVKVMLASPGQSAEAIWQELGTPEAPVWLEPKMDGIRVQLHTGPNAAEAFSRDLRSLSAEFPDIIAPAAKIGLSAVFDGEIIAHAEGRQLTFFDLQKRLGRRRTPAAQTQVQGQPQALTQTQLDLFLPEEIPPQVHLFDLLWLNGRPLLDEPLTERRRLLETLRPHLQPPFTILPVQFAQNPAEISAAFAQARKQGREGLMAKNPKSTYQAGRRGQAWLKLKRSDLVLDCVVVKAEQGHGKRSHVLSDYTFAVRDTKSQEIDNGGNSTTTAPTPQHCLKIIGKAYSGLTDAEIEELTEHFTRQTISIQGKVRTVVPDIVLEIGFDSIQPSKRHESGLSLRFPRIRAIRRDKTAEEADTLQTAERLAGLG